MKFTRILLFIALFPVLALAQDPGAVDSVELVVAVSPNSQTGQANLQLDLFVYNDEPLIEASMGFSWDNPNIFMDSAIGSPLTVGGFTNQLSFYENDELANTNTNQHFLFHGVNFNTFPADSAKKRHWASYYFTSVEVWSSTDTIKIDTLTFNAFSAYQFVDMLEVLIVPDWAGGLEITDSVAANQPPVLDSIGPQIFTENQSGSFSVSGFDPDGTTPILTTSTLPTGATFNDNANGTGTFNWTPNFTQSGVYNVTFYATDGVATDSEIVVIQVNNVNRPPVFQEPIEDQFVDEGEELYFGTFASDPDFDRIFYYAESPTIPDSEYTFEDIGKNFAEFYWTPGFNDAGVHSFYLYADDGIDGIAVDTVLISVNNINVPPMFVQLNSLEVNENDLLDFLISAIDIDGTIPALTVKLPLPLGASFTDNGNGTASFNWQPDCNQSIIDGSYSITCYAADDSGAVDTGFFQIYVYEFCDVELSVDQASCVQCVPPQTYADILVYEPGFVIEFNNHVDPSTLEGNILFNSRRGISFDYFYNEKLKQIEVYPRFSSFAAADTIMVSLNTNILDLSESPLDSSYNLVYRTGGLVYPGDCNNDGTVNEIDVLSIGLYYTNTGPNRDYEYYESGPFDFFAQPVHFERGLEVWSPVNGVYADVDGSGVVDANDICGVAYNFGNTVDGEFNLVSVSPAEKKATLKDYGTSVLQAMYDALIECQSDKAPELMEMIEAALRESSPLLPTEVELYQNYPNPFNPSTTIELYLPKAGQMTLEVYNMLGQRVITLLNEEVEAGYKEVTWPSIDNSGSQVASGIYFYKLVTESKVITKRMLLVK